MDDYSSVFALWRDAGPGIQVRPSDSRDEVAKKLDHDPDLFWVAQVGDRVVGVIMGGWDGRRGWLHHLTVDARYRRQGIATALVRTIEERLAAKGCLKINLLVRGYNVGARDFYHSLGYDDMIGILPMGKEL